MPRTLRTELTLPNDPQVLPMARRYARQLTELAELPGEGTNRLIDAVVEACANVLEHAFEPGEEGTFSVIGEVTPTDLIISVRDHGLPFDPLKYADTAPDGEPGGLARMREAVDRFQWLHRGRQGKELQLVKHRPNRDVIDLDEAELKQMAEDEPLAPEQDYTIARMRPDHAMGVCRCVYRVYGNTYMHEDCYYPDRMVDQNETGHLVSIVSLDAQGDVVGHYALERPRMTRVAERGIAVVSPDHRGRDLMGRMRVAIEEQAKELGLEGVYSVAVTHHTYSQRVNEEFGSDVCGVNPGGGPSNTVFRKIGNEKSGHRVTWVIYFTYVKPPERSIVHVPERHRAVIERIYFGLPVKVEYREGGPIPEIEGDVEVSYSHTMDSGMIRVELIGQDTCSEVRRAAEDLINITGADVVNVELPLAQAATPALCDALEAEGFFFCGIGPGFAEDGDALLLEYLPVDLDKSVIQIANPFAQELLEYSLRERERSRKLEAQTHEGDPK